MRGETTPISNITITFFFIALVLFVGVKTIVLFPKNVYGLIGFFTFILMIVAVGFLATWLIKLATHK